MIAAHKLLGKNKFIRSASKKSKIFKRSIFVVKDIDKGEKLTKRNIRRIRPGYGWNQNIILKFWEKSKF